MRIWITIILFALTANFANAQRNAEREQLVAEIRAYIAEVDFLVRCYDCDLYAFTCPDSYSWFNCYRYQCDAKISEFHESIIGGLPLPRKILGIRLPASYQRGGGGMSSYTLFSNCPDSATIHTWHRECEKRERIYSWEVFSEWHRRRGARGIRINTYYRNNEKVAEIRRVTSNGISETTTTFYNNRGRVIYRSSTREKQ